MARRSKKFYGFTGLLGVIVAYGLVVTFNTGPITGPVRSVNGLELARAGSMSGVTCEDRTITVRLSPDAWFEHDVAGTLCHSGEIDGRTLAVTVSGAGYDSLYWDFPYEPETYSFTRAALKRGFVVFNFDRLGMGRSDRPFGLQLGVDNQAHVLAQIIDTLRTAHRFAGIVTLGHSFGSTISLAHALVRPDNVDGIVLTGFVHNSNPGFSLAMRDGVDLAALEGPFAGALFDPTYLLSKADSRGDIFYTLDNTDPDVVRIDEVNRQTTSIGEVISMSKYFSDQSKVLTVPAFTLLGEDDFVVCGGAIECTDHAVISAFEAGFFPPDICHEIVVLDDTNHNANLHLNAAESFRLMLDWIERRVGNAGPPVEPCSVN